MLLGVFTFLGTCTGFNTAVAHGIDTCRKVLTHLMYLEQLSHYVVFPSELWGCSLAIWISCFPSLERSHWVKPSTVFTRAYSWQKWGKTPFYFLLFFFFCLALENLLHTNDNLPVHFVVSLYTLDPNICTSGISDRSQHWASQNRWSPEVGQHGSAMQSFGISGKCFKRLALCP